jgi:TolB-like protein/Tol biopolymer transport system component
MMTGTVSRHSVERAQCDKVLASKTFADAPRLRRFLGYIIDLVLDQQQDSIKEYSIGVDVFERRPDFDSKTDPIVRVQAGRLRLKLKEYYDHEGHDDNIRIEIPRGSYVPVFHCVGNTEEPAPAAPPPANSIAVLPFAALSPEPEIAQFSDGLTEEIIHALSAVEGLKVVSRTSAFFFKGRNEDVRQIGAKLRVSSILEGSVRGEKGVLRVTAQLVDTDEGYHRWSSTHEIQPRNALASQKSIAGEIRKAVEGVPSARRRRRWWPLLLAAAPIVIASLIFWQTFSPPPFRALGLTRITSSGAQISGHWLSPDGKFLAYLSNERDPEHVELLVRQMESRAIASLPLPEGNLTGASFSPDSAWLLYGLRPRSAPGSAPAQSSIYRVPVLGGPAQKLLEDGAGPRYSPDGKWISFCREERIFVLAAQGGDARLVSRDFRVSGCSAWAPDSTHLLFYGEQKEGKGWEERADWWVASRNGGPVIRTDVYAMFRRDVIDPKRSRIISPDAWHGNHVIFSSRTGEAVNLWSIAISPRTWKISGEPERLTYGTAMEGGTEISADGKLVFKARQRSTNLYSFRLNAAGRAEGEPQPLTHNSVYNFAPNLSRDGNRLVYVSNRSGDWEVWVRDLKSGREELIYQTPDQVNNPRISPDGTSVVFGQKPLLANAAFSALVPITGGPARKLCFDCGNMVAWTANPSKILLMAGTRDGTVATGTIATLDLHSGSVEEVLRDPGHVVVARGLSADGRSLALQIRDKKGPRVAVAPFSEGRLGPPSEWKDLGSGLDPVWSLEGKTLYWYSTIDGHGCIWGWRGELFPAIHFHHPGLGPAIPVLDRAMAAGGGSLFITMEQHSDELWTAQLR